MYCHSCGAELEPGSLFCQRCGTRIEEPAPTVDEPRQAFCENCGARLPEDALFCDACGASVPQASEAACTAAQASVASATAPTAAPASQPASSHPRRPTAKVIAIAGLACGFVALGIGLAVLNSGALTEGKSAAGETAAAPESPLVESAEAEAEVIEGETADTAEDTAPTDGAELAVADEAQDVTEDVDESASESVDVSAASSQPLSDNTLAVNPDAVNDPDGYILPFSDSRYYTVDELNVLTDYQLYLARNEMAARIGREWKDDNLRAYFESKTWYVQRYTTTQYGENVSLLCNSYVDANSETIVALENARGSQYAIG